VRFAITVECRDVVVLQGMSDGVMFISKARRFLLTSESSLNILTRSSSALQFATFLADPIFLFSDSLKDTLVEGSGDLGEEIGFIFQDLDPVLEVWTLLLFGQSVGFILGCFFIRSVVRVAVVLSGHILDATALVFYFLDNFLQAFAELLLVTFWQWVELIWHEGLGNGGAGLGKHLVVFGGGVVFLEHDCKEVLVWLFLFGLLILGESLPIHLHDLWFDLWINNNIGEMQVVDGGSLG
jgi:hypothetical protein